MLIASSMLEPPSPVAPLCAHCGDFVPRARQVSETSTEKLFCCDGCEAVHGFLRELQLEKDYYALKSGKGPYKPVLDSSEDYSLLDGPSFRDPGSLRPSMDFFLEGIHCSACLWILERLPDLSSEIASARLDMGRSLLRVQVTEKGRFETAANLLLRLGYRPHPIRSERDAEERLRESDRTTLRRMGVSAFAAMNVMIYSVSLYSGVGGAEGVLFRWLSILTSIPALTYGAWPFYRNAWNALRARRISIDLPIAIAFIGGFAESLRQTLLGSNLLYLDSLTSLVFLMLGSRYALSRLERAEVSKSGLLQVLLPSSAVRWISGETGLRPEKVNAEALREGDLISLERGNSVPVDGTIESGEVWVDLAFLTGESHPQHLKAGDLVYAGSRVVDGEARAYVVSRGGDTRLGRIETQLDAIGPRRNRRVERSDRWAVIFLASVLGFAALLLLRFGAEDPGEAVRRSLSLLIIACPCALAFATPLTLARAYRLAASRGVLLRNPEVLDQVAEITNVAFDKTGTLTQGQPGVREWDWVEALPDEKEFLLSVAYSLERHARHPYGKAIVRWLENQPGVRGFSVEGFAEIPGVGVRGEVLGRKYSLERVKSKFKGRLDEDPRNVRFERDGVLVAAIAVADEVRAEASEVIGNLRDRGLQLSVLSGDAPSIVQRTARALGIADAEAFLSPEEKKARIEGEGENRTLMIGDGINDALALRAAHVGVAMNRGDGMSVESALANADAAVVRSDLRGLEALFDVSKRYRSTLLRNALFSAGYNLVGASFAALGLVHPLVAAVAMPISALTVYLSTALGLRGTAIDLRARKELP